METQPTTGKDLINQEITPRLTVLRRVDPVDALYSSFPMFMSIDPSLGKPLLEGLFRSQAEPGYAVPYAALDLGKPHTLIDVAISIDEAIRVDLHRR